jgi:twitching motility protein PilT
LAGAAEYALSADADVLFLSDLDPPHIDFALRAAQSAHLVFATLDTLGAVATLNHVINAFPVDRREDIRGQLGNSLLAILSQVLVPRLGSPGMIPAYEFLVNTPAVSDLIRENNMYRIDTAIETGKKYGMQLVDDHLFRLASGGTIAREDALERARDPAALQARFDRGNGGESGEELTDPFPVRPDRPPPGLSNHAGPAE